MRDDEATCGTFLHGRAISYFCVHIQMFLFPIPFFVSSLGHGHVFHLHNNLNGWRADQTLDVAADKSVLTSAVRGMLRPVMVIGALELGQMPVMLPLDVACTQIALGLRTCAPRAIIKLEEDSVSMTLFESPPLSYVHFPCLYR